MFKNVYIYGFFHCMDKGIMWIFPLFFLHFFNSQHLYAEIELIISYIALLLLVTELGIRNYVIYAYNTLGYDAFDRSIFLLLISILIMFIISFFVCLFIENYIIVAVVFSRLIYFTLYLFLLRYYRWKENAIVPILFNIVFHILTIILVSSLFFNNSFLFDQPVISKQIFLIIIICYITGFSSLLIMIKKNFHLNTKDLKNYFFSGLRYGAPALIVGLSSQMLPHLTKLITFETNKSVMIEFSLLFRYCIIMQVFHGIFFNYFTKEIFTDMNKVFPRLLAMKYILGLFISSIIVLFILKILTVIELLPILIGIAYVIVWCLSSSLELFFGRVNKNIYILFAGLSSITYYLILMYNFGQNNLTFYLFILLTSSLVYFTILSFFLIFKKEEFFYSEND